MSKPIVKPREELDDIEVKHLRREDRDRYFERYVLKLLHLNKERGIGVNEIFTQLQQWTSKPTLLKLLETLLAKRQVYKVKVGKSDVYFPNGRPLHPLINQSVSIGDRKYRFQLLENQEGLSLYVQEMKKDLFGVEETMGGIMIPFERIDAVARLMSKLMENRPRLIEQIRHAKIEEIDKKLEVLQYEDTI